MELSHKYIIATGGTGGHLYPALVLAGELKSKGCEVMIILGINPKRERALNTPKELERYSYRVVPASPLSGFRSFLNNLSALRMSWSILKEFKPNGVIGFGSYACVPTILAASLKGVPIILHEQNSIPGWANRIASLFVKKVALSFKNSSNYFFAPTVLVGNLVRRDLFSLEKKIEGNRFTLLVFGGSSGAKSLNQLILHTLPKLELFKGRLKVVHITGSAEDSNICLESSKPLKFDYTVLDYAQDIPRLYAQADLVVSRAGATTIFELIAAKIPAVLIPYPYATSNHQNKNGMLLSLMGSAVLLNEGEIDFESRFLKVVTDLILTPSKLVLMRESYDKFPISLKNSAENLAQLVLSECR